MSRTLGLIGVLIALAIGAYLYTQQAKQASPAGAGNVRPTIDVAGVKSDLLVLANAERGQFALEGKYASLEELVAKGSVSMRSRPPYRYSAEVSETGFRITATYEGPPASGAPRTISIDESMQIRVE